MSALSLWPQAPTLSVQQLTSQTAAPRGSKHIFQQKPTSKPLIIGISIEVTQQPTSSQNSTKTFAEVVAMAIVHIPTFDPSQKTLTSHHNSLIDLHIQFISGNVTMLLQASLTHIANFWKVP